MITGILIFSLLSSSILLYAIEDGEDLLRQLESEDPDEREEAVEILGQSQDQSLIDPLVNILLNHTSGEVRGAAAIVLFRMGHEKTRQAFTKALEDQDLSVRLIASGALYKFGDLKALNFIIKTLKDPSQEIRLSAVAILAEIGDTRSVELLQEVLQDPDQDIRELAQEAIEEFVSNLLQVTKTDSSPIIDGLIDDSAWIQAAQLQITTEAGVLEGPTVTLQALQKEDKIYFLVTWMDQSQTRSVRHHPWVFNGTTWTRSEEEEDRLALIFPMTSIPSFLPFSDKGCLALCHRARQMYTNAEAEQADLWIWRAARSNPVGQADDWILRSEHDPESGGQKADTMETSKIKIDGLEANRQGYTINLQKQENKPLFTWSSDVHLVEGEVLLVGDAAPFNSKREYAQGDSIPGYLIAPFTGSRGDIQAKGTYKDGRWVVEFCRALNTGHQDDIQFEAGKEYLFSLKVFDGKEFAAAKKVYRLKF